MRALEQFGWFVFNVAIPLFAPLALLPLARLPSFFRSRGRGIVRRAVEHGQMLWAAIPMSASACQLLATMLDASTGPRQWLWAGMALHVFLIVIASAMVLLGAMQASVVPAPPQIRPWLLWGSSLVTFVCATTYFAIHISFSVPSSP